MEENDAKSKFRRICVFCGSSSGHRKVFSDAALELGNELVCSFLAPSLCFTPFFIFFLRLRLLVFVSKSYHVDDFPIHLAVSSARFLLMIYRVSFPSWINELYFGFAKKKMGFLLIYIWMEELLEVMSWTGFVLAILLFMGYVSR